MKTRSFFILFVLLLALGSCNNPVKEIDIQVEEEVIVEFGDHGPDPFVFDIEAYTLGNDLYRRAIWTGSNMQMTLMSLAPGEEIGLEKHPEIDQFLRIESGKGIYSIYTPPEHPFGTVHETYEEGMEAEHHHHQ